MYHELISKEKLIEILDAVMLLSNNRIIDSSTDTFINETMLVWLDNYTGFLKEIDIAKF